MKFNLQQTTYKKLLNLCGIYLLQFSNGKLYIGSSVNIQSRIKEHITAIMNNNTTDAKWYGEIYNIFNLSQDPMLIFPNLKIYVEYTQTKEEAYLKEKQALTEIYANKKEENYYNSVFYYFNGEKYKRVNINTKRWSNKRAITQPIL